MLSFHCPSIRPLVRFILGNEMSVGTQTLKTTERYNQAEGEFRTGGKAKKQELEDNK